MEFKIKNYRGIKNAHIELGTITLIAGKNATGKSSSLQAIASVATGLPIPYKGVTKKQASRLVHSGTPAGSVELTGDNYSSKIAYPECEYSTTGDGVVVGSISAGVINFTDLSNSDRIKYITELTGATPEKDDLKNELEAHGLEKYTEAIWESIELNGWDIAHQNAKEHGVKTKGAWEFLTGEKRWGINKGASWQPAEYTAEIKTLAEEKLSEKVDELKDWVLAGEKNEAVKDFEEAKLKEQVAQKNDLILKQKALKLSLREANVELDKIRVLVAEDELVKNTKALECPKCQTKLKLDKGALAFLTKTQKKQPTIDHKTQLKEWDKIRKNSDNQLALINSKLISISTAEKVLEKLALSQKADSLATDLDQLKEDLAVAEAQLEALKTFKKSSALHLRILTNATLQKILGPKGLRLSKLKNSIREINFKLKKMTDTVMWGAVEITDECDVLFNNFPYGHFVAKSERYRVNVLLQLIIAKYEQSSIVLVDDADELTNTIRSDLIKIIIGNGIPAIVATAIEEEDKAVAISSVIKRFGGHVYWVDNCETKEV